MRLTRCLSAKSCIGRAALFVVLGLSNQLAWSGNVEVRFVELSYLAGSWRAAVTLAHDDSGWSHYADGWRLVTPDGKVLGHRTLWHPHEQEQPFTRQLSDINIPDHIKTIEVEAHDKVHGWSPDKVRIDLNKMKGKRYRINR